MIAADLIPCPSGGGCVWLDDPAHVGEYSHPCPHGAVCNLRADQDHCHSFTHPGPAPTPAPAPAPARGTGNDFVPDVVHTDAACDHCRKAGFRGYRFKCMVCPDYDLCQACSDLDIHDATHPLVRFATKTYRSATFMARTGLKHNLPCTGCRKRIVGVRFACTLDATNLCQSCELKGVHDATHPRIKIVMPAPALGAPVVAPNPAPVPAPVVRTPILPAPAPIAPRSAVIGGHFGGTTPTAPPPTSDDLSDSFPVPRRHNLSENVSL